ncbi:hypothetical protein LO772_31995 [Yinghuangia sp. ASG 101]|uniref:hypothetical protein n=1 Tax=Yinghuangia sp. ASG 101 TaxID=2896848 RepID=UPI001E2C85DB|nr:hypothetical protein [Yinghuangia sp. ASG 101]UGQ11366.1 hypothetical protein LO772_31995 [Yinghuangia sp. ASG 101]
MFPLYWLLLDSEDIEPATQFGIGVIIRHEPMPAARWTGFALVWAALLLLVQDAKTSPRESR